MELGIHLPHIGRKATPEVVTRAAVQAEGVRGRRGK